MADWDLTLTVLFLFGVFFFTVVILMMRYAARRGQFRNFEQQARMPLEDSEPEGFETDEFPDKKRKRLKQERKDADASGSRIS